MIIHKVKLMVVRVLFISALVCCWNSSLLCQSVAIPTRPPSVLGTWKGESICSGNRPACKNEIVVYRFEAVAGKPDVVMSLADKIIEGERVPMGKLEFQYDEAKGKLSCEFTIRQTHGLWQFTISGDSMEGTLILLPDREIGRRVKVRRVGQDEVPVAPDRKMYEGR